MLTFPRRLIQIEAITKEFKAALMSGRVGMYGINLHAGWMLTAFVLYGYTGGQQNNKQAARTAKVARAIVVEIGAQPAEYTLICGDFNNEPMNIHAFKSSHRRGPLGRCGGARTGVGKAALAAHLPHAGINEAHTQGFLSCKSHVLATDKRLPDPI